MIGAPGDGVIRSAGETPRIRLAGIVKRFPGITALAGVSFDVAAGSCHAVCGENGAGKSTLGRIIAGILSADEGTVQLDGAAIRFGSPRDALAAGVAMVHQELAFCDNMTVAENLCLGHLPRRALFVDGAELRRRATALLASVGSTIDPDARMSGLSVAEQQVVQIAAAVGEGARVIVFDEPTSSLGEAEAARLYDLIRDLVARGVSVLYVSHRMPEIFALCDHITVLRDGSHVGTWRTDELDQESLVTHMIGRKLEQYFASHPSQARGDERLRVEGYRSPGLFEGVSFSVHAGEVVGLAGLVGAGRSEIARAIFGLDPAASGQVTVRGRPARIRSARDAMRYGIGYVPEDRKRQGLVLSLTTAENVTLPILERLSRLSWVNRGTERRTILSYFDKLRVRATPNTVTAALSGGNQQKIVLSKWLAAEGDILILDEPTRGVDVGTKAELHAWIDRLATGGAAILLISSELPELLNVASRILVLREGRLVGELTREEATQDRLLRMMSGV
jgi:ABC-type sugar transport system ATPase subunit